MADSVIRLGCTHRSRCGWSGGRVAVHELWSPAGMGDSPGPPLRG